MSATTLPPPPIPLIPHLQQTPVPTPTTVPSSSLQDLPNFGSLFGYDHRLKTLENDFSKFKQTNQFAAAVSSIPGIVDTYLANKMNEAVKTTVQLQSDRLRNEAQADNEDFINKLDANIKKIIKEQKNLYKALLTPTKVTNPYLTRMEILSHLKDVKMMRIKTKNPPLDQIGGPREEEPEKNKSQPEPMHTAEDLEEPAHQEFVTRDTEDKLDEETSQLPDWFQKLAKPPTPDRDWNKILLAAHGPIQPRLSTLA
ncbi:hypothetical protein Tco_0934642 [Tanacetum coccineum]